MAVTLFLLALVPVGYGALIAGDFTQKIYKPTRKQVYFVVKNRHWFLSASAVLWMAGVIVHLFVEPISLWVVGLMTFLTFVFTLLGFVMAQHVLFRVVKQPEHTPAAGADNILLPEELVIGVTLNGDAIAYPIKLVNRPHVIEDMIADTPFHITYCLLCNSALAFKSQFGNEQLNFVAPLQWENNLMLYDRKSQRLIQQINGEIVCGPDAGQKLEQIYTQIMSWSAWHERHPESKVYSYQRKDIFAPFVQRMLAGIIQANKREAPYFPTIERKDSRLPNKTKVLGVSVGDSAKAYEIENLNQSQLYNERLNQLPLLIIYDADSKAGSVFHRQHANQTLTFNLIDKVEDVRFVDSETGSHWNTIGQAVAGPLKGERLAPYPHLNHTLWYSWANFYPRTGVVQQVCL